MPERTGLFDQVRKLFRRTPQPLSEPTEKERRLQSYLDEANGFAEEIGYKLEFEGEKRIETYKPAPIRAMTKEQREELRSHLWKLVLGNSMMPIGPEAIAEPLALKHIIDKVEMEME